LGRNNERGNEAKKIEEQTESLAAKNPAAVKVKIDLLLLLGRARNALEVEGNSPSLTRGKGELNSD
jgi:hypothetical protein